MITTLEAPYDEELIQFSKEIALAIAHETKEGDFFDFKKVEAVKHNRNNLPEDTLEMAAPEPKKDYMIVRMNSKDWNYLFLLPRKFRTGISLQSKIEETFKRSILYRAFRISVADPEVDEDYEDWWTEEKPKWKKEEQIEIEVPDRTAIYECPNRQARYYFNKHP